ncbi:MAG: TIGR00725 family protein [Fervidobacterium sp.]|uniref:TIGR00725 family protein n=1 Tax=Fervidobacterium sp. TaxID=1871331 RepID=UPI00404B04A4
MQNRINNLSDSLKVGVIGYSGDIGKPPVSDIAEICTELGKELGKRYTVFTGGRDGVMELVCKGAREVGGITIGVLPWEGDDANEHNSFVIKTGLDFQMRSFILVKSVDVVVSVGGEIGTAVEILAAYANRKPVILLRGTGGWTDRIAQVLIHGEYLDNRKLARVYQARSVQEVIDIIEAM